MVRNRDENTGPATDLPTEAPGNAEAGEITYPTEADLNSSITERESEAGEDLLCVAIANEEYALDIRRVWEIIRPRPITEIPRVPDFIRGIISLRGEIVPVLDLRGRLGFPPAEVVYPGARIVVAVHEGKRVGMTVDAVSHKIRVPQSRIAPPASLHGAQESGFITGVCRHQGRIIAILDADAVLGFQAAAPGDRGETRQGPDPGFHDARRAAGRHS